jgi:hypothetical protein
MADLAEDMRDTQQRWLDHRNPKRRDLRRAACAQRIHREAPPSRFLSSQLKLRRS